MRFILSLLFRSRAFLLFVGLELLALALLVNNQSYQRSRMMKATQELSGQLRARQGEVRHYFHLRYQNELLHRKASQLQNLLPQAYNRQYLSSDTVHDTLYQQRFRFIPAELIGSSYAKRKNFATINKGSLSGIEASNGVLGPQGVYGVVQSCSPHFSAVIPLINPQLRLSGKIKGAGYFGPLSWDGRDYRYGQLNDIPRYAEVQIGDTIVTDGRSRIFPTGVLIGTVEDYRLQDDQNFYELRIRYATDFSRMREVSVVSDLLKREWQQLDPLNNAAP